MNPGRVLGIDPGTGKAGFAVLDADGTALVQGIEGLTGLLDRLKAVVADFGPSALAVGRGTNAARVTKSLEALGLPIHQVDEYETTRFARSLYFAENPPAGWRRLVPLGLQVPPRPVDDYAAILIARRYLDEEGSSGGPA
ncbi:MAG TPA: RuvX/YqgF family protein [Candidatus Acidoferrales bacterium]|jgi:RNase H-fold protein (predicted Holliday junction resolvase)|nr:RuvX/YqgF family protein [Candidatus Acidoferrales bacterium]